MGKAITNGQVVEIEGLEDTPHYITACSNTRNKRNTLLAETDWMATSDRTMTQAEIDYRQALRDVPAQAGFPENITWPTKP